VAALAANEGAAESDLIIYADGPKSDGARPAVESVRAYLKTIVGFKTIKIIERDRNWGLADSIMDGVTNIIGRYGKVIVMEDDIKTSPYFLRFMNDALTTYENEDNVMHISGYVFPISTTHLPDTFFYNQTSCWGWATWKRAWDKLDTDVHRLLKRTKGADILSHQYNKIALSQLRANKRQLIKTWAARWQISVSLEHGNCLHPARSLTLNIGHDGSGVHSQPTHSFDTTLANQPVTVIRQPASEHPEAVARINRYLCNLRPSLYKRIYTRLKQLL
jgi:hypothetical protein